jgi:hypothetical protein
MIIGILLLFCSFLKKRTKKLLDIFAELDAASSVASAAGARGAALVRPAGDTYIHSG